MMRMAGEKWRSIFGKEMSISRRHPQYLRLAGSDNIQLKSSNILAFLTTSINESSQTFKKTNTWDKNLNNASSNMHQTCLVLFIATWVSSLWIKFRFFSNVFDLFRNHFDCLIFVALQFDIVDNEESQAKQNCFDFVLVRPITHVSFAGVALNAFLPFQKPRAVVRLIWLRSGTSSVINFLVIQSVSHTVSWFTAVDLFYAIFLDAQRRLIRLQAWTVL